MGSVDGLLWGRPLGQDHVHHSLDHLSVGVGKATTSGRECHSVCLVGDDHELGGQRGDPTGLEPALAKVAGAE